MKPRPLPHWIVAGAFLLVAPACGSSSILLEIHANLTVPDQANSLHITTLDVKDATNVLADVELELNEGRAFPIEVLMEPSDSTPSSLREQVTALLDGNDVAHADVTHQWSANTINRAKIDLAVLVNP